MEPNKKQNKKISFANENFRLLKISLCHFDAKKIISLSYRVSRFWVYPTEATHRGNYPHRGNLSAFMREPQPIAECKKLLNPTEATIQAIAECLRLYPSAQLKTSVPHRYKFFL